jgi:hypothetical protein
MMTKREAKSHLNRLTLEFAQEKRPTISKPKLSQEKRERIFSLATSFMDEEKWIPATDFFRFLVLVDPNNQTYWSSLEYCLLKQEVL